MCYDPRSNKLQNNKLQSLLLCINRHVYMHPQAQTMIHAQTCPTQMHWHTQPETCPETLLWCHFMSVGIWNLPPLHYPITRWILLSPWWPATHLNCNSLSLISHFYLRLVASHTWQSRPTKTQTATTQCSLMAKWIRSWKVHSFQAFSNLTSSAHAWQQNRKTWGLDHMHECHKP